MAWRRTGTAILLLVSCAPVTRRAEHPAAVDCTVVVFNRTPHILEVRVGIRPATTLAVGTLNPGELLHHEAPCAQGALWVGGIPVPDQAGAPVWFRAVEGWTGLEEGVRSEVALHWP